MKVAVIGGGFAGLSAAYELTKRGYAVTVFEREKNLGGLAGGFKESNWDWSLECSYHHWFTNDRSVLTLIQEVGLEKKLIIQRPITANLLPSSVIPAQAGIGIGFLKKADPRIREDDKPHIYQLDSPVHLLKFPGLSMIDKFRTAALLAFLKFNPFWKSLENITAEHFLCSLGGKNAYKTLWEPLLIGKFGDFAPYIQAAWFWARIKKRTPRLMYMEGGFKTLIDALEHAIKNQGGIIKTESGIVNHESWKNEDHNSLFIIHNSKFDKVLLTVPTSIAQKIVPEIQSLPIPHLTAQTLILETDKAILERVYWLNITDRSFPFLAAVAHTNFMDKKHYGGHHLTYFSNYLPPGHPYLSMTKEQLLKKFMPFIQRLSHNSQFIIHNSFLFTSPYAQPVHQLHYSSRTPKLTTTIPNVYLANMDSIVPWDRGVNYSVLLGRQAAKTLLSQA